MRKIGIFKGIFDPISQRELKEALSWMKNEKLSFVVFEIENDATISISERKALVKKAIKPYRKLLLDYNFQCDDVILHKEASNIDEEELDEASSNCDCEIIMGGKASNGAGNFIQKGLSKGTPVESMQKSANELIELNKSENKVLIIVPREKIWHFEGTLKALGKNKLDNLNGFIWLMDVNEKFDKNIKLENKIINIFGDKMVVKYGDYLVD